ncbi:hypothetical protein ACFL21_01055 [Patescibacteria group bacterium]
MAKKKNGVATSVGKGLAHVQSVFDDVLSWSFRGLKKVAQKGKDPVKDDGTIKAKLKKGFKKSAGFLGEIGDSFYRKYEDIKADKKKDREV